MRPKGFGAWGARPVDGAKQGRTLAAAMLERLDADRDALVNRAEFTAGFGRWFSAWSAGRDEGLSEQQLHEGIRADIFPPAAEPNPTPPNN